LAGKATAAREAAARQAAIDRQVMQIQAQQASQVQAQAHQKEMAEFDAYMDNIRYQSAEAWELEKMELRSRHDFEMIEAKRELDFQNQVQREMRKQQEVEVKLKALAEKAPVEMGGDGYLTAQQYQDGVMKIETGWAPKRTDNDFRKIEQDYQYYLDTVAQYKKGHDFKWGPGQRLGVGVLDKEGKVTREATPAEEAQLEYAEDRLEALASQMREGGFPAGRRTGQEIPRQVTQPSVEIPEMVKTLEQALPSLDTKSQTQLRNIITEGNPVKIRVAFSRIKETVPETSAAPEPLRTEKSKRGHWFAFPGGPPSFSR